MFFGREKSESRKESPTRILCLTVCFFRYKTPMLRGDMDPGIDKFEIIEKLMAEDLENWLCNFYFEIIKLPRYLYLTFYKHK